MRRSASLACEAALSKSAALPVELTTQWLEVWRVGVRPLAPSVAFVGLRPTQADTRWDASGAAMTGAPARTATPLLAPHHRRVPDTHVAESLAVHVARFAVLDEPVERAAAVRDLRLAVRAPHRPERRGARRLRAASHHERPPQGQAVPVDADEPAPGLGA